MKRICILFLFFLLEGMNLKAQTITVSLGMKVYFPNDTILLDLNGDLISDMSISRFFGIDNVYYLGDPLTPNLKFSSNPQAYGTSFSIFNPYTGFYGSLLGCDFTGYTPGHQYTGTQFINSPGDTTFGYLEVEFIDPAPQNTCIDTMFVYSYTYSQVSNFHLTAGQVISGIDKLDAITGISIYYETSSGNVIFYNSAGTEFKGKVINCLGQNLMDINIPAKTQFILDTANLSSGIFFLRQMKTSHSIKFVKN